MNCTIRKYILKFTFTWKKYNVQQINTQIEYPIFAIADDIRLMVNGCALFVLNVHYGQRIRYILSMIDLHFMCTRV